MKDAHRLLPLSVESNPPFRGGLILGGKKPVRGWHAQSEAMGVEDFSEHWE